MEVFLQESVWWLGHAGAALLCLVAVFVSLLSFTGAWLIAVAAGLLYYCRDDQIVSPVLIVSFIALSVLIELFDFFAGSLGISRRGGSAIAGVAALFGGIAGMVAGSFIPVPVLGSLFGMCAGSFFCAFWVERRRLRHDAHAAHIAWGAVWARLIVMFVKTIASLGMTAYLWYVIFSKAA